MHSPDPDATSQTSAAADTSLRALLRAWCKILLDLLLFYTTAFFVLLAIFSLFALIFLIPFLIDPAWQTIQADFDIKGTLCRTVSGLYLEGKSNCNWTSCQEGCTKDFYTCWQVEVEYIIPGVEVGHGRDPPKSKGQLFPNIKGCGYPPRVDCDYFVSNYSPPNATFMCHVSRTNPSIVVPDLDLEQVHTDLFYSLAVPVPCFLIAVMYLVFAYFYIYAEKPEEKEDYSPVVFQGLTAGMTIIEETCPVEINKLEDIVEEDETDSPPSKSSKSSIKRSIVPAKPKPSDLSRAAKLKQLKAKIANGGQSEEMMAKCIRLQELTEKCNGSSKEMLPEEESQNIDEIHFQKVQLDRQAYGKEKYSVMAYYQYYGLL